MPGHDTPLIAIIAIGLALAFVLGLAAHRLRMSPLVGYLLAGIVVGPFTPGLRRRSGACERARRDRRDPADVRGRPAFLAEGPDVGPHDRPAGRHRADRGRHLLGMALAWASAGAWGRGLSSAWRCRSPARSSCSAPCRNGASWNRRGRIAVGWLIVEDLAMVLALVLLPALAARWEGREERRPGRRSRCRPRFTLAKVAAFVAIMLVAGRRIVPWIMHYAAHTGSRELFRLAVYAVALGIAYGAAALFGVSSRSAPSSPAWFWPKARSASAPPRKRCRCGTPSRCCSSCRSACCSIPASWSGALAVLATLAIIVVGKSAGRLR